MKKIFFLGILLSLMTSCASFIEVGDNTVYTLRQVDRLANRAHRITPLHEGHYDPRSGTGVITNKVYDMPEAMAIGDIRLLSRGPEIVVMKDGRVYDRLHKADGFGRYRTYSNGREVIVEVEKHYVRVKTTTGRVLKRLSLP